MFRNYLKTAFRNLWRHRAFSFINIMGLTVGMTACFLIFLYVRFETSYESFHPKADRIYRMVADVKTPTETLHPNGASWATAPNVKDEFPEVEAFVRIAYDNMLVRKGDIKFMEPRTLVADSAFFQVFGYSLIKGNPATALKEPLSVVLSQSTAKKYFGDTDPVGQTLLLTGDAYVATVTGVMKDMPENSQIKGDIILSMTTRSVKLDPGLDKRWGSYGSVSYLLLKPGTDAMALQKKLPAFLEKRNGEEMRKSQMYVTLLFEPLRDIYLYSARGDNRRGNIHNVYIFSVIAVFILLIACINFVNLTTARSTERAKEVGIRKVVGAGKIQLTRQFIGESVIISLIAFLFTLLFTALLLPGFNRLAGKIISPGIFSNINNILVLLMASIMIGILAGCYPALILSAFKPIVVLKGRFATGTRGILLRKGLVVTQFTISIALIIATLVVYNQMSYMRNFDLGFKKDQMLVIDSQGDSSQTAFKEALKAIPGVSGVTMGSSVPGIGWFTAYSEIENKNGDLQIANLNLFFVDFDYIPQYKIKVVAGRPFSRDFGTDTTQAMIMNEAAIKMFGYSSPQQALGRRFKQWGREGRIIGVIKDFHYTSLQQEVKPLTMRIEPNSFDHVSVNVTGANLPATIAAIEKTWKTMIPNRPFSYSFLDEAFDEQYRGEERFGKLFLNFAVLAIFISCMGLLGLASYSTMQRTKEIGIRKVMGASVGNIIHLLSKDFLKLVAISFVVAAPVAWFMMDRWLRDFAYRTNIGWWVFMAAGLLALVIAVTTVSFQAVKAAIANPTRSLRTE